MPRGKWVLFDTNVYAAALREGVSGDAFARALIALSARQVGAAVVTGNAGDFELLRRFVRFDLEPFES